MNKLYDEQGCVAVVINNDHGGGWISAYYGEDREDLLFDGAIANMVLAKADGWKREVEQYCEQKYPIAIYWDIENLEVVWVMPNKPFIIHEYDGLEEVWYIEDITAFVA